MKGTPNPASGMSLVYLVDLARLQAHSPGDREVQEGHGFVFRNFLVFPGVQVDKLDIHLVSSQVDMAHQVGKEGTECLDTQGGMEFLGSNWDRGFEGTQMDSSFPDSKGGTG